MESEIEQLLNFKPEDFSSSGSQYEEREVVSDEGDEAPLVKSLQITKHNNKPDRLGEKDLRVSEHHLLSRDVIKDNEYSDLLKLSISDTDSEIEVDKTVIGERTSFFNLMDDAINKYTKIYNPPQRTTQSLLKDKLNIEDLENLNIYVTNFYSVTQKLLRSKQSQKNYILTKSITFAIGDKFYVAISDISGCIIFYNLKSKSIELLEENADITGYCTVLEFSKDSRYLVCGFYMGDIKIYEVSSLLVIQTFNGVFLNPVVSVFSYNENDFLAHDNSSTMAAINVKRNYFMINKFETQKIDFFSTYKILCTDLCTAQIEGTDKSGNVDLLLACLDKNKVSLFQISPVRKNIELFYLADYLTCISCGFNKTTYTQKKDILFYILAGTSLLFYTIPKVTDKLTSQPILNINVTPNFVYASWLNDITLALIDDRIRKVVLYNIQIKKNASVLSSGSMEMSTKDSGVRNLTKQNTELMDLVSYKKSEENIEDQMKSFEPVNKLTDTIRAKVMKTVENPQRMVAIDHKGQVVDLKLKNWREYFDNLLDKKSLDIFLSRFNEVFEGNYCFFNDYIHDKTSRERIMVSYLQDKIQRVFEDNPSIAENHVTDIMSIFFSMKQYDFVYHYLHDYYERKNINSVYINKLEPFLDKKTIKYLQPDFAMNLIEYYNKSKQHDIVMLILSNLEAHVPFLDKIIDFCVTRNFWISLIIVCFNSKPPSINKLLQIFRTKIDFKRGSEHIGYHPHTNQQLSRGSPDRRSAINRKNSMPADFTDHMNTDCKQISIAQKGGLVVSDNDFKDINKVLFWVYHFFLQKSIVYTNLQRTYYDVVIGDFYDMLCDRTVVELFISLSLQDFIKVLLGFFNHRNYGALRKTYFKDGRRPADLLRIINTVDNLTATNKLFFSYLFDEMLDSVDDESTINEPVKHYNSVFKLLKKDDNLIFREYTDFLCESLDKNIKLFSVDELTSFITKLIELYSSSGGDKNDNRKTSISKIPNTDPTFSKTDLMRTPIKKIGEFKDKDDISLSHSAVLKKSNTEYKEEYHRKTYDPSQTNHDSDPYRDLKQTRLSNQDDIKIDFLDEMKSSVISIEGANEKPVSLAILSLLTDILYKIGEYETIFKIWTIRLTSMTKKYMFHFVYKKTFNIDFIKLFVHNLGFFIMCSITATFDIFNMFDVLPYFDDIETSLDNLYSVRLKFYDYMLKRYKDACYDRKTFFHNYLEALIREEDENAILNFIQAYSDYIEIFDVLKLLSGTRYYRVFASLYEKSKDHVKAFSYYFILLKNLHMQLERVDMQQITTKLDRYMKIQRRERSEDDININPAITPIKSNKWQDDLNNNRSSPQPRSRPKPRINREKSINRLISRSNRGSHDFSNEKYLAYQNKSKTNDYFFIDKEQHMRNIHELIDILEKKLKLDHLITSSILSQSQRFNNNTVDDLADLKVHKVYHTNFLNTPRAKDTTELPSQNASLIINENKISPFTNINALTISDMMNFCKNNTHKKCLHLKSLFMLQVIVLKPKNKLQDLVLDFDNKLLVYVNILNEISTQMLYYKRVEGVLDKDLKHLRAANYITSCSFDRKCMICNKPLTENKDKKDHDFVIAKPECGHIYHNSCAIRVGKKLLYSNNPVIGEQRGKRRKENENNLLNCKVCEFIHEIVNQKINNPNAANKIISTISNVVEPVTGVLNVFKTATVGIFDVFVTFGMSEKDTQQKKVDSEKVVVTKRKSVSHVNNKDKFRDWMSLHVHTELQIKLDKLRHDEVFISRFLNL